MFTENANILKKDKYFTLKEKKNSVSKSFTVEERNVLKPTKTYCLWMKLSLKSPLSTASIWLSRSSDRRHQLWDRSLKLSLSEAKTPELPDRCFCGRNLFFGYFLFLVSRPCRNLTENTKSIRITTSCGITIAHQLSSQDILFRWQLLVIWFFNSYTLEKHFSSWRLNFPAEKFVRKTPNHPDFCCLYQTRPMLRQRIFRNKQGVNVVDVEEVEGSLFRYLEVALQWVLSYRVLWLHLVYYTGLATFLWAVINADLQHTPLEAVQSMHTCLQWETQKPQISSWLAPSSYAQLRAIRKQ